MIYFQKDAIHESIEVPFRSPMKKTLLFLLILSITFLAAETTREQLQQAYNAKGEDYKPRTKHLNEQGRAQFVNRLILSDSPYLLQHAHNPVDWFPWADEAFALAQKLNKPIFISIGYATCHWCHVMEEESFEDIALAAFLNQHFVAIKLDREVSPDIDASFMRVSMLLNGSGGWPLNLFLLPNGQAFYAFTYLPRDELFRLLVSIQQAWQQSPLMLINQAKAIKEAIEKSQIIQKGIVLPDDWLEQTTDLLFMSIDEFEGGFSQAPKFPNEPRLSLLLDYLKRNPNQENLERLHTSLTYMASGGLHDVVGGGFHRYSTDNSWLVPHFEKMLYNQAQMASIYAKAYEMTENPLYERVATRTLDYVLRELGNPSGGFISATDADSEGEEGVFFVWDKGEIEKLIGAKNFQKLAQTFDFSDNSLFEHKHIIRYKDIASLADQEFQEIDELLRVLYQHRLKRPAPLRDYKVLLSWNALLAKSFMQAGLSLKQDKYLQQGLRLVQFLFTQFDQNKPLLRLLVKDQVSTPALFEDYVYLIDAYLLAYDVSGFKKWLNYAEALALQMNSFWDEEHGGYFANVQQEHLKTRLKIIHDGALPAANGVAYQVLHKLYARTGKESYYDQAENLLSSFAEKMAQNGYPFSSFAQGLLNKQDGESETIIYAYGGKVKIHKETNQHQNAIRITLQNGWHINSHKPRHKDLVATKLSSANDGIHNIEYPQAKLKDLAFTTGKLAIYEKTVEIGYEQNTSQPHLDLQIQACSTKVCLPPTKVKIY